MTFDNSYFVSQETITQTINWSVGTWSDFRNIFEPTYYQRRDQSRGCTEANKIDRDCESEYEFSLWKLKRIKDFNKVLKEQRRKNGD